MNLSDEQEMVVRELESWVKNKISSKTPNEYVVVGGYAGTGKTTIIGELRKRLFKSMNFLDIAFATFTGKASLVLKTKLENSDAIYNDFIGTIHRLIYEPVFKTDKKGKKIMVGWDKKNSINADLIIIDEASMISKKIWDDLMYYKMPIIAIGDHGQLPPIGDAFSLMTKPDLILTEVHRQAINHPIIKLSMYVRKYGQIPYGLFEEDKSLKDQKVFKFSWNNDPICQRSFNKINFNDETNDVIALCGMNKTRVGINNLIRNMLNFNNKIPDINEKIICLKNNYEDKIFNGQIGEIAWMSPSTLNDEIYNMSIDFGNEELLDCLVHKICFGQESYDGAYDIVTSSEMRKLIKNTDFNSVNLFDFGYCVSVHKSQGSEWNKVILFEERSYHWDDDFYKRWLYTAVTRAKEKLFVIIN